MIPSGFRGAVCSLSHTVRRHHELARGIEDPQAELELGPVPRRVEQDQRVRFVRPWPPLGPSVLDQDPRVSGGEDHVHRAAAAALARGAAQLRLVLGVDLHKLPHAAARLDAGGKPNDLVQAETRSHCALRVPGQVHLGQRDGHQVSGARDKNPEERLRRLLRQLVMRERVVCNGTVTLSQVDG
eukprot:scaffold18857_cov134-Isochrysis_galbana.AAC.2